MDLEYHPALCDTRSMSETLSVRLPPEDKRTLFAAAARRGESVNEFVRGAIRARLEAEGGVTHSALREFFRSVNVVSAPPTNETVRKTMRKGAK